MNTTANAKKSYTLLPTLTLYAGLSSIFLGLVWFNGWLFAAGLIVAIPFGLIVAVPMVAFTVALRQMRKHPENYETVISEDVQGNITNVSWKRISR